MTRFVAYFLGVAFMASPAVLSAVWINAAESRLEKAEISAEKSQAQIAVASQANEEYCTPGLKKILRRVLQSCGLIHGRSGRGCQPMEVKQVATMGGDDFNALFIPMAKRGGIIQFDQGSSELDPNDTALIEKVFADRKGASYFFVVSRASPEGSIARNRELSRGRAESVLGHLQDTFNDPDLQRQVGLLWLGEEYAQLEAGFCSWKRSGAQDACTNEDLNRSAFVTWIDCTL